MNNSESISTVLFNAKRFFVFILSYLIGGVFVILVIATFIGYIFIVPGVLVIFFIPLIFQKRFRAGFSKDMVLNFDDERLSIEIKNRKTGETEKKNIYKYSDIQSYKAFDSAKDDSSVITLVLNNGEKSSYSFVNQSDTDTSGNVTEVLAKFIQAYNASHKDLPKVAYTPPLFARKFGRYSIIVLTVLLIAAIFIEAIYNSHAILPTLVGGGTLYLTILLQMKKDVDQSKKRM